VYFVTYPKQGLEMKAIVLHKVAILEYFCLNKPLAAPLYPNMGQVPPPEDGVISVTIIRLHEYFCRMSHRFWESSNVLSWHDRNWTYYDEIARDSMKLYGTTRCTFLRHDESLYCTRLDVNCVSVSQRVTNWNRDSRLRWYLGERNLKNSGKPLDLETRLERDSI